MPKITKIQNLKLVVCDTYEEMSHYCSNLILEDILKKPNLLFCTATGSTPTLTYQNLAKEYQETPKSFEQIRIIKLDEWGGVPMNDPATCESYLQEYIIQPLRVPKERYLSLQSDAKNPEAEVKRVATELQKTGRIDLCTLGIGTNGHIAFNEADNFLENRIHVAQLAKSTTQNNMATKSKHKMSYGLTLGLGEIMNAKHILLMVNGQHKAEIFAKFLSKKITTQCPASMLWMHPNITVVCDKAALI